MLFRSPDFRFLKAGIRRFVTAWELERFPDDHCEMGLKVDFLLLKLRFKFLKRRSQAVVRCRTVRIVLHQQSKMKRSRIPILYRGGCVRLLLMPRWIESGLRSAAGFFVRCVFEFEIYQQKVIPVANDPPATVR